MKKLKTFTAALVLVSASISVATPAFKTTHPEVSGRVFDAFAMEEKTAGSGASGKPQQKAHQVIAYYFHSTLRCTTCFTMEQFTKEAVTAGFPDELENGQLVLKIVNIDDEGNEHFVKDYQLQTKSVVIVDMKDGAQLRWKNLENIWNLVDDKKAFIQYIQDETRSYLEKG